MAPLTAKLLAAAVASMLPSLVASVTFDWNITWVHANPDGMYTRPTMGINGQWPLPVLNITKGDNVVVHVHNQLGNESTSIHFHGLYQNGTTHMDGPVGVSQCEIPPGASFTYNFTIDQPGTYWYHSHIRGQYPDGLRGPLYVHDPESPFLGQYDEEVAMSLSDWYHDQMPGLISSFISYKNPTGAEPVPDSALMNDQQNKTFAMQPGKTYLFRIVNIGAFAAHYLWFEGHTMRVVEVDGIYTEPAEADQLYVTVAQRYSVLVTARNDTSANFAIVGSMDQDLFDQVPDALNPNVTGYLVYDQAKPLPEATLLDEFSPFDDFNLVPYDQMELLDHVDHSITLNMKMDNLGDGANYAFFNETTYVPPKVPTLYSVLSTGNMATNPAVYGVNTNSLVLKRGEVVELILNNDDSGKHPFHLHGHVFQVVTRSEDNAGHYAYNTSFPQRPMRRDTLLLPPQGNFVVRWRADNPGVWLFHCHIEWHIDSGLVSTFIEAPLDVQRDLVIPEDHWQVCRDTKTPTQGNAAGNTMDLLDLRGANVSPDPLPAGFTARGIVALVFSVISAFLGLAVISWYGAAPIGKSEEAAARERIERAGLKVNN